MPRLEARFHLPVTQARDYVVVGYVVWRGDDSQARVEPALSLTQVRAPVTLLATLKHLVVMTAPKSFDRLRSLRSRHWTFVSVDASPSPDAVTEASR